MSIVSLFCEIDDFFLALETYKAQWELPSTERVERRGRPRNLHTSEVVTILIAFHQSHYRTFKAYYEKHVCLYWCWAFPKLVSYNRFVELMAEALPVLRVYLYTRFGKCSGFVSLTQQRCGSVATDASQGIAFSASKQDVARPPWAGSTDSNFI